MNREIEGYTVVLTGIGLERFRRQYKDQFMVVKHKYDAKHGQYPGKHDDHSQNFSRGSQWVSADGSFFICVDNTPEKARWLKVAGTLSKGSFVEDESENEESSSDIEKAIPEKTDSGKGPEKTKETKDEKEDPEKGKGIPTKEELEDEGVDTKKPGEELEEKAPMTNKNKSSKGIDLDTGDDAPDEELKTNTTKKRNLYEEEIPDEVPYKARLINDNRVQNLGHLVEHIKNGTLHELKHLNEDRAEAIKEVIRKIT